MKRQLTLFLVAAQFLTRLPVPQLDGFQPNWLPQSARYFPLVGALIASIGLCVWRLSLNRFPSPVAIGLTMAATLLLTGAFHEDGFADVCDGFGGGGSRESILAIMKDSRIGAYGAIGIVMMLGLKWATWASLPRTAFPLLFAGAQMGSRWCATSLICRLQYVRTDADAKSKPLADGMGAKDWLLSGALGAMALMPMLMLEGSETDPSTVPALLAALAAAGGAALLAGMYFKKRIGGYTGDCLGAAQQVAELSFCLAALAVLDSH